MVPQFLIELQPAADGFDFDFTLRTGTSGLRIKIQLRIRFTKDQFFQRNLIPWHLMWLWSFSPPPSNLMRTYSNIFWMLYLHPIRIWLDPDWRTWNGPTPVSLAPFDLKSLVFVTFDISMYVDISMHVVYVDRVTLYFKLWLQFLMGLWPLLWCVLHYLSAVF